ncbi:MAG: type I-E CRISPR-associated protein Cse1/CasA [Desulfovibrio sp.]|nr:type I-E CRISPR-associated protein Cse1/CasA [Desulfovibrio sp.]
MMNLAVDPWIPCIGRDGAVLRASLLQCLTDGHIADFAVRPHERVALMRLLLCVAHAALGIPEDYKAWLACREGLPEATAHYLEQWRDSFELFHPKKPFLQMAGLRSAAKPKAKKSAEDNDLETDGLTPASKLDFALAVGNNSTLFDHEALNSHRAARPEKLALDLLTYQMFSPGGLIGSVVWSGQATGRSSSDAPCVPGSMLHTFVRGTDLPETVWLNLLSADILRDYAALGVDWRGRPLWEMFPKGQHDEAAVRNAVRTFIGRLVPLSRAILLQEDGVSMLLGNGLTYPTFSTANQGFPPEPSAAVVVRKGKNDAEERMALGIQPGKGLWRELHALTVQRQANTPGGCLALAHMDDSDTKGVDLVIGGLARDQANIVDVVESVFHVPAPLFRTEGHDFYANEVQKAEDVERRALAFAMERWRTALDGGWATRLKLAGTKRGEECAKLRAQAARDYWTAVEHNLPQLLAALDALGTDAYMPRKAAWRKMLRASAFNAYAAACKGRDERQLRAFVTGQRVLLAMTNKILELHKEEEA